MQRILFALVDDRVDAFRKDLSQSLFIFVCARQVRSTQGEWHNKIGSQRQPFLKLGLVATCRDDLAPRFVTDDTAPLTSGRRGGR